MMSMTIMGLTEIEINTAGSANPGGSYIGIGQKSQLNLYCTLPLGCLKSQNLQKTLTLSWLRNLCERKGERETKEIIFSFIHLFIYSSIC